MLIVLLLAAVLAFAAALNPYATSSSYLKHTQSVASSTWGFLKPPTRKGVVDPLAVAGGKRREGLVDAPPKEFDYLIVMDFEWSECYK
jgi:hypothetical protein